MYQQGTITEFPSHALPGAYRHFVDQLAGSIGYDASIAGLPVLLTLASAIGTSRRIRLSADSAETAVMQGLVVANNRRALAEAFGDTAKPLRMQRFLDSVTKTRTIVVPTAKPTKPLLKYPKAPKPYVVIDSEAGSLRRALALNPKGFLLMNSHFAEFTAFPEPDQDHRVGSPEWVKSLKYPKFAVHLPGESISVCGGTKPAVVEQELLKPKLHKPSLLQSYLLTFPARAITNQKDVAVSRSCVTQYGAAVKRLLAIEAAVASKNSLLATELVLSKRADLAYQEHCSEQSTGEDSAEDSLVACHPFYCQQIAKLALVLELAKWSLSDSKQTPTVVHRDSVDAAIELADWFYGEVSSAYTSIRENAV